MEKHLGKIAKAEFGTWMDRPFMMGLQLEFHFGGYGVNCGGKHLINISGQCSSSEEQEAYRKVFQDLNNILTDAKVNNVSELVGKPVEITIENQMYKSFRILTEVL